MSYNTRAAIGAAQHLLASAEKHGVKLPKTIASELERTLKREALIDGYKAERIDLREAMMDALEAGNDPITDPGVTAAVVSHHVALEANRFQTIGQGVDQVLTEHRNTVIDAFKPAFNAAIDQLKTAHQTMTNAGITSPNSEAIIRATPNVFTAAGEARQALATLDSIMTVRARLSPAGHAGGSLSYMAYIDPEANTLEAMSTYRSRHKSFNAWEALTLNIDPSMANYQEERTRGDAYNRLSEQAETRAATERRANRPDYSLR